MMLSRIVLLALALGLGCSCSNTNCPNGFKTKVPVRLTVYWKNSDRWTNRGLTSTGASLKEMRTVAVDPKIIPYHSEFLIESNPPLKVVAEDTGSAVKSRKASRWTGGQPVVDVFFHREIDAIKFRDSNPDVVHAFLPF